MFGRARGFLPILAALALAACASQTAPLSASGTYTPKDAVFMAADAAPKPVPGIFVMTVRATGRQDGNIYLNSELDYRDQRNLSIEICPPAFDGLQAHFGSEPDKFFLDKRIAVTGQARRVKIHFMVNGAPSDKYYYQTHVTVCSAGQIALAKP